MNVNMIVLHATVGCWVWTAGLSGLIDRVDGPAPPPTHAIVHLGGNRFLGAFSHEVCASWDPTLCHRGESPDGFIVSPRGDRITLHYGWRPSGIAIFDATTGDTAFTLPATRSHPAEAPSAVLATHCTRLSAVTMTNPTVYSSSMRRPGIHTPFCRWISIRRT